MSTTAEQYFSPKYYMGSECDPAIRQQRAEQAAALARAEVAAGKFIVLRAGGVMAIIDPIYIAKGFRPERWMTQEDIQNSKRLPHMEIGETLTLPSRYHPRHGVSRYTVTRLA